MSLNFVLSEENNMLVDALGDAMKPWTNERKAELQDMVEHSVFPEEMWQTFADVGLLGCLVPEEYGGTDVGLLPLRHPKVNRRVNPCLVWRAAASCRFNRVAL